MSHVPHELHEEFPEHAEKLHALKLTSARFNHIADAYHEVNREIHRIESGVTASTDEVIETLKKQRLKLLDEVHDLLVPPQNTGA